MRKTIYAFGIATFLAMLIFTIATSLTNPFYGMTEAAIAQATTTTTSTTTDDCNCEPGYYCAGGVCYPDQNSNKGTIDYIECPDGSLGGLCGGTGGGCSGC